MLFCVDGIDRFPESLEEFLGTVRETTGLGVVWVVAGRSVPVADGHPIRFEVPPLTEADVRPWLMDPDRHPQIRTAEPGRAGQRSDLPKSLHRHADRPI